MFTATFYKHQGNGPEADIKAGTIADGHGKTPNTAIRAALSMATSSTSDTVALHIHDGDDVLRGAVITAYGTSPEEAAKDARSMLKKARAGGGR